MDFSIERTEVLVKTRGRPTKDTPEKWRKQFQLRGALTASPRPKMKYDPEGMFVLLTTIPDGRKLSDQKLLEAYKGQTVVEVGFHWLKGPMAVAPVFLKLPSRIDVLGFVYLISMFLYALVQREVRAKLAVRGGKIMRNCGQWTDKPTTDSVFRMLEGIERLVIRIGDQVSVKLRYLSRFIQEILDLMAWNGLYENPVGCT